MLQIFKKFASRHSLVQDYPGPDHQPHLKINSRGEYRDIPLELSLWSLAPNLIRIILMEKWHPGAAWYRTIKVPTTLHVYRSKEDYIIFSSTMCDTKTIVIDF